MQFSSKLIASITLAATMASAIVIPRQEAGTYTEVFEDEFAAVQGTDFITFTLVDTTDECTAFCDSVPACGFANSYLDNNGKGGSTQLTCSLYTGCHDTDDLLNTGGQTQPDGTVNFITNSDGFCKVVAPTDPAPTEADPAPTDTAADPAQVDTAAVPAPTNA